MLVQVGLAPLQPPKQPALWARRGRSGTIREKRKRATLHDMEGGEMDILREGPVLCIMLGSVGFHL